MSKLRYGCQTYTWQMSYEKYSQKLRHIIDVVSRAGMQGIEPEICMLGPYNSDPKKLGADLVASSLTLSALCLVCDWRGQEETAEERVEADRIIDMIGSNFPGTLLALCQMPGDNRTDLTERQRNCIACVNDIGQRAADAGVVSAFHPNSPEGSVFRVSDDYAALLEGLQNGHVGFAPDSGHIAKGGMNPVGVCRQYAPAIKHVHFKDMTPDGRWVEMGKGSIDFRGIVQVLDKVGYDGWVMVEDESSRAEQSPDEVTLENGEYVGRVLKTVDS